MGELTVTAISVPGLIDVLQKREWLIPKFQRDFVWTVSDIVELVLSIFEARPIGMATLWEQTYPLKLALAPISITDYDPETKQTVQRELGKLCTGRCAERLAESGHDNRVQRMEVE